MPHVTLECSANVKADFQQLFKELSALLVETGHAAQIGVKCRLVVAEEYYIYDGDPEYKMVNLLMRLREGRSDEVLEAFSRIAMGLMKKYFEEDIEAKKIILSTEIKELKKGLDITENSIR